MLETLPARSLATKSPVRPFVHQNQCKRMHSKLLFPTPQLIKMMKLLSLFLILGLGLVSARTTAQTISLSEKQSTLKQVFKAITTQAKGYEVFYNSDQVNTSLKVDATISKASLEEALTTVLKTTPYTFTIEGKTIVISPKPAAPQVQANANLPLAPPPVDVRGKVVNEKGEPLAGVSVLVKGTKRGTSTDENGVFELKGLAEDAVLQFKGVNIEEYETPLRGRTEFNFTAKAKISTLQDVEITAANTGYQTIPKERATGSFSQISNSKFNEQVTVNVLERLEAIANGVSVDRRSTGANGRVMIRGLSTLNGPRDVLVVVDNFPYAGSLDNINPNDVESITLLKDAAAASIWGTKAGNGVIVITTKKGKFHQRTRIEFNSNITIGAKPNLFYQDNISSSEFIDLEKYLYDKGYFTSTLNSTSRNAVSPVVELLARKASGALSAAAADAAINAYRTHDLRNDYLDLVYKTSVNKQYSLNATGGTDKLAWIVAGNMDKNMNNLEANYDRMGLRTETKYKILPGLQAMVSFAYTQSKNVSGANGYGTGKIGAYNYPSYISLTNPDGTPASVPLKYRQSFTDTAGAGKLLDWNYYPLTDYQNSRATTDLKDIVTKFNLSYEVIKSVRASFDFQYENQQLNVNTVQDLNSYYTRDLINTFTQIVFSNGTQINRVPKGGILDLSTQTLSSKNFRGQLDFDRQFSTHRISAIAGVESRENDTRGNVVRTYGYDVNRLTFTPVDLTTPYITYIQGSTSFIPSLNNFSHQNLRFVSVYANASDTYLDRYTVSISGRRDASNLFGVKTGDKWTPLWSIGTGWEISKEKFYRSSVFSFLKLRATYGFSGNADPSRTGVTTISYISTSPYTGTVYADVNNYYNPELRWEKVGMFNIGFDFAFRNNVIAGSLEYYHKKATDLFGPSPLDVTVGLGRETLLKNVASMTGDGVDIELHSKNTQGIVKWNSSLNFSIYRDKVTDYLLTNTQGSLFLSAGKLISGVIGKPVYSMFGYKWAGLDPATGDPQGYFNGAVSKTYSSITGPATSVNDLVYLGPAFPTIYGSLGNTISFKKLKLTVQLTYKFGYWFQRPSISYASLFGNYSTNVDYLARWQKPGDEMSTNVPSLVYPAVAARDAFYLGSESLVERGDHIRVKYVTLSYDYILQHKNSNNSPVLQFYINANNLGFLWRHTKSGLDPDIQSGVLPTAKSVAFGVRAIF